MRIGAVLPDDQRPADRVVGGHPVPLDPVTLDVAPVEDGGRLPGDRHGVAVHPHDRAVALRQGGDVADQDSVLAADGPRRQGGAGAGAGEDDEARRYEHDGRDGGQLHSGDSQSGRLMPARARDISNDAPWHPAGASLLILTDASTVKASVSPGPTRCLRPDLLRTTTLEPSQ